MLQVLRIHDMAIIESLELELGPGLNILTGETGAGKSIIVGALALVLGGRASPEIIRKGAEQTVIEAWYALSAKREIVQSIEEAGLPVDPDGLLVRRVISRSGRSRAYVNGAIANLSTLQAIMGRLVDFSSQHEQVSLLNDASHLRLLDSFSGLESDVQRFQNEFEAVHALRREWSELQAREHDRAAREDFLRFQIGEIDAARLVAGEDEKIEQERSILLHAERLRTIVEESLNALAEQRDSARARVLRAHKEMVRATGFDPTLQALATRLDAMAIELEDLAQELHHYRARIDADPRRLEQIEQRRELLRNLGRKYGSSIHQILQQRQTLDQELASLEKSDQRLEILLADIAAHERVLLEQARHLSHERKVAAHRLERQVQEVLASLAMTGCRFGIALRATGETAADLTRMGFDRAEFVVATNVGEDPHPLARTASGGELSRIMLALKYVLTQSDEISTYVFDEVDAGIGGQVAHVVGCKLQETSRAHQIICITHLPQIACFGDRHFRVAKNESGGRTMTTVEPLEGEQREAELARMLGGRVSPSTCAAARELLRTAAAQLPAV